DHRVGPSSSEWLPLGWFGSYSKELGDISQTSDKSNGCRNETARRVDDYLGSREFDVSALRTNATFACRKNVLHPIGIRSIREHKDVVIVAAEHVDGSVVHSTRCSPSINQDAEPGRAACKETSDRVDEVRREMA